MDERDEQDVPADEPELDAMEQAEIPFLSDVLLAVLANDGAVYVPIIPFCEHLGLGSPKHQVRTIRADEDMHEALRLISIQTRGGMQKLQCLRVDMLALWLTHIRSAAVKESARPALRQYKREAARAILNHFLARRAVAMTPTPERPMMPALDAPAGEWATYYEALAIFYRQMAAQQATLAAQQQTIDRHDREIGELAGLMEGMKETLAVMGEVPEPRISIHQTNELQALVSKIHDATGLHQGTIFAAFKKQWRLPRYDELPAAQYDAAYEWLRQWGRARLPK